MVFLGNGCVGVAGRPPVSVLSICNVIALLSELRTTFLSLSWS